MGSIEIFDFKEKKWVPYVPDYGKWLQHFRDIRDGYAKQDSVGRYVVGSGSKHRKLTEAEGKERQPAVTMVSPIVQNLEMAKSQVKREKENDSNTIKKRKKPQTNSKKHKRLRSYVFEGESQLY